MSSAALRRKDIVYRRPRRPVKNITSKTTARERRSGAKLVMLSMMLGAALIMNLTLHAFIAENGFVIQKLRTATAREASKVEEMKLRISYMQNPGRIRKLAVSRLGMVEPTTVRYLTVAQLKSIPPAGKPDKLAGLGRGVAGKERIR